ncbi:MAG: hypothetical protein A4E62_02258 [Syntrophorhabdus sp. PtaU1.Bin002]|nr:MAG: hypothetical protein A4E58_00543 [Syntrophorhabdus sp. PtaB.Bin006]OPY67503.1 MAG: hypothetical protein A4E62_02258 [Syntrophorhabdus sp. PtaU1.Bin002]
MKYLKTDSMDQEVGPFDANRAKKVIRILISSKFYFNLTLQERHGLIRYILSKFPYSL